MIGKTVSHYRILSKLGAGGMGVVYAGEDVRLGRPVALKFVPEELAQDKQAIGRLISEARTASALNHPNICTVYDIGEYEGQPFIVMELLTGQTLRQRLGGGPLKPHDAVDLGIHVADALDAAHRRDVVHRDIKPANLFLVDRGQVKILDFGLAKLVSGAARDAATEGPTRDRTAEGMTLGTVSYMSPEQVTGEELDGRSDLFSLGVVLYEALTGHQPFTGKTSALVFSAILARAPVAPIVYNPDLPVRLQEIINNCLEKDRELRYQDAAGLRADLRRIKRDLESGRSGVYRTTGAVVAGLEGQATSTPATLASQASAPREAADGPTQPLAAMRRTRPYVVVAAVAIVAALAAGGWFLLRPTSNPPAPTAQDAPSPAFIRSQLSLAAASIESRDYRAALGYADEVLRAAPGNAEAMKIRDAARAILSRFDEATTRAGQRLGAGDFDGAASALETARSIDPAAPIVAELSARLGQRPATPSRGTSSSAAKSPAPVQPPQRPATESPRASAERSRPPSAPPPPPSAPSTQQPSPPPAATREPPEPAAPPASPTPRPANPPPAAPAPASPPAVAPPTVAPPPPEPAPPAASTERRDSGAVSSRGTETDDAAIRRVIATYARAIETKDLALFKSVKPNMSSEEQRRITDGFRAVTTQQINVTIVSIDHTGSDAAVRLRRRDTIQAGGRRQTTDSVQTMTLTRGPSGWVIREIGQ